MRAAHCSLVQRKSVFERQTLKGKTEIVTGFDPVQNSSTHNVLKKALVNV